jgi:hypothetical protein
MSIAQVGTGEQLHRFNNAVGNIGKVYGPYGPYSTTKQPYFLLQLCGFSKVQAGLAMLWVFLCSPKKTQAVTVLRAFLTQPERTVL